jgi:molybdenum cofactor cytidylyltransferase
MAFSQTKQRVCAVISAAGLSSRMGDYKPLMPFGGETIAARCMENLRRAGVDDIIVVTGYRGEELRAAFPEPYVRFAENPDFRTTQMFDSIRIGFAALPADCIRVVIQPVDMPAIRPETIEALLRTEAPAVRPVCQGRRGHPLVLDAALIPHLAAYDGSDGLRGALETLGVGVADMPTEDEGTLLDADTKEDYVNLLHLSVMRYEDGKIELGALNQSLGEFIKYRKENEA